MPLFLLCAGGIMVEAAEPCDGGTQQQQRRTPVDVKFTKEAARMVTKVAK